MPANCILFTAVRFPKHPVHNTHLPTIAGIRLVVTFYYHSNFIFC